jgi:hypothetical protein
MLVHEFLHGSDEGIEVHAHRGLGVVEARDFGHAILVRKWMHG